MAINIRNNVKFEFGAGLTSVGSILVVKGGKQALLPPAPFQITLLKFNSSGVVIQREIATVTAKSGDILTISRATEATPLNDNSVIFSQTAYNFDEGDIAMLSLTQKNIDDIYVEIATKLTNGDLRTGMTNWRLFYTNGSGQEVALGFGSSGQVLQSNGANSAPGWISQSININGLTENTSPVTSWFGVFYNGTTNLKVSLANLVKGLNYATKTAQGVMRFATDVETNTGTIDTVSPTVKQVKDKYGINNLSLSEINSPPGSFSSPQYSSSVQVNTDVVISLNIGGSATSTNNNNHGLQYSTDNTNWTNLYNRNIGGVIPTDFLLVRVPKGYYIRVFQGGTGSHSADIQVKARWQN